MKKSDYCIESEIGHGSFGNIYKCINKSSGKYFAIKVEISDSKNVAGQLQQEYNIYREYRKLHVSPGIKWPQVYEFGYNSQGLPVLVMDLFGKNLEYIFRNNQSSFSIPTVAYIADKMINLIKVFHSKGYVHRDLKPQNFVVDLNSNEIFIIDYGLAKKVDKTISFNKSLKGTVRYASINTHLGIDQSYRDDLCSIGYILVYFCTRRLPWQNIINADNIKDKKECYNKVMLEKMSTQVEKLVENVHNDIKESVLTYMLYVSSLSFYDIPDYAYCASLFNKLYNKSTINLHLHTRKNL